MRTYWDVILFHTARKLSICLTSSKAPALGCSLHTRLDAQCVVPAATAAVFLILLSNERNIHTAVWLARYIIYILIGANGAGWLAVRGSRFAVRGSRRIAPLAILYQARYISVETVAIQCRSLQMSRQTAAASQRLWSMQCWVPRGVWKAWSSTIFLPRIHHILCVLSRSFLPNSIIIRTVLAG